MVLRLVVDNDRYPSMRRACSPYAPVVQGVAQGLPSLFPLTRAQIFASPYAPVVHSIAQSLNELFPPIYQPSARNEVRTSQVESDREPPSAGQS